MEEPQGTVSLEKPQENPTALVEEKTSPENSEYDSVDSYSEHEEEQPVQVTKARSRSSVGESRSETEGSVILEREEGDGQESLPAKKVDDDEDKKNPQYIPKRGTFYEHDDRTAEDLEEAEKKPEEEPKPEEDPDNNTKKNKFLSKEKEKWSHDRFNEMDQAPKNKTELISIYGYDIRNEEGPPRARRRRRYGRGPNKYTRNWEDEEAYTKPAPKVRIPTKKQPRPRKNQEEFPPLGGRPQNVSESVSSDSNRDEDYIQHDDRTDRNARIENRDSREMSNRRSVEKQEYSRRDSRDTPQRQEPYQQRKESPPNQEQNIYEENKQSFQRQQSSASNRVPKPKKEIKDSDYKGFTTKTRQGRVIRTDHQKVLPPRNANSRSKESSAEFIQSQNFTNSKGGVGPVAELERDMGHLNVQDGIYKGKIGIQNQPPQQQPPVRQGSVPPRLQQGGGVEQKGTKRYSSMRQRSLPDSATPPVGAFDPSFYPSDYNSAAPPPPSTLPPNLVPQPVPVTVAPPPMLQPPFPPAAFAPQGPPPAFLQAPPPAFIAGPPQPQIVGVSYVQPPQPQFTTAPPAFPPYQPPQFPVTQPELYQPQGGITYYSADQQIIQQRVAPQKRPKAAIPIVAPNDYRELQRGSSENIAVYQHGESSDSQEYIEVHE